MRTLIVLVFLVPFTAGAQECFPNCRDGFVCVGGQCVSRCNPPCGVGERCTAAGECEGAAVPQPPPAPSSSSSYEDAPRGGPRELPGWALGGAVLGFVSAGAVGLLATASGFTTGDLFPSLPLGALATLIFGITVPLVASSSSSVRSGTGATGVPGLRVAGWIFYGLTLADAVVAVVLGFTNVIPAPLIFALGGLGILTESFMSIDALVARAQASEIVERNQRAAERVRLVPYFTVTPGRAGATAVFGMGARF